MCLRLIASFLLTHEGTPTVSVKSKLIEHAILPNTSHHSKATVSTRNVEDATVLCSTDTVQYNCKSIKNHIKTLLNTTLKITQLSKCQLLFPQSLTLETRSLRQMQLRDWWRTTTPFLVGSGNEL